MAPDVRTKRASELDKKGRKRRLREGLCTKCQKGPPVEGGRMCLSCREKGKKYVMRNYLKKRGELND